MDEPLPTAAAEVGRGLFALGAALVVGATVDGVAVVVLLVVVVVLVEEVEAMPILAVVASTVAGVVKVGGADATTIVEGRGGAAAVADSSFVDAGFNVVLKTV